MKKLMNEKTEFVHDMIEGLLLMNDKLDVINETVLVRKEKKEGKVALISGGGSGHEPAHAGYVAKGMLDAAVCGEVFTSPTPDKILDAIKHTATEAGVLLIVKNYAGDVMNFEMAMDMAVMEDIKVDMVVISDDITIENKDQRRGVAGTVFVHKLAGYMAENGSSLEDIKNAVTELSEQMSTVGMALTPCMVPTTGQYGFDLGEEEMEIGIGIHGEQGIYREQRESVDKIIKRMLEELYKERSEKEFIVMINGMGGTPISELAIVRKYMQDMMTEDGKTIKVCYTGDYMTALDMQGFSITLVPYRDTWETAFKAPTESIYFN